MRQGCTSIIRSHIQLAVLVVIAFAPLHSEAVDFSGIWTGTATSSIGSSGTVLCRGAVVNVLIDGPQLKGTAVSDVGDAFTLSGSLSSDGTITNGSFAVSGTNFAVFTGRFSTASATGSWNDAFGCFGTFRLDLAASYVHSFDELWAGNAVSSVPINSDGNLCGTADLIFNLRSPSIVGSIETNWGDVFLAVATLTASKQIVNGQFRLGNLIFGSFSGSVSDSSGSGAWSDITGCAGTFTVSRIAVANRPPVANDLSINVFSNSVFAGMLSAIDPDGDGLTFIITSQGSKGVATITNAVTGEFVYAADGGVTGTDSFQFKVNDSLADSNIATVTATIEIDPTGAVLNIIMTILLGKD